MNQSRFTEPLSLVKAAALALLLIPGIASGATAHLKIGDIKGESSDTADGHKDWIVIESVSFGTGRAPTPASNARRAVDSGEVSISKSMDASSPKLQQACSNGTHFPEAELHVEQVAGNRGRTRYIAYTLTDVIVTCTSSGGQPTEDISLNYSKMTVKYVPNNRGQVAPATSSPTQLRPQRVSPKPRVQGIQSDNQ